LKEAREVAVVTLLEDCSTHEQPLHGKIGHRFGVAFKVMPSTVWGCFIVSQSLKTC